jgi:hypothetical protein
LPHLADHRFGDGNGRGRRRGGRGRLGLPETPIAVGDGGERHDEQEQNDHAEATAARRRRCDGTRGIGASIIRSGKGFGLVLVGIIPARAAAIAFFGH